MKSKKNQYLPNASLIHKIKQTLSMMMMNRHDIFHARAININMKWKQENLVLIYHFVQELTLQEAETIALSILKQVMEEKVRFKLNACTFNCLPFPLKWDGKKI